jgi:enoyl-CoA hydratase/E-phenylitaconyl-CoA hydratase/naphthyl-2-hydroxymethylsuccinyl-CoA hydratase
MKEFVIRFRETPVTEAWRVQTLMNALLTQLTTDGDEGREAFLEKRAPQFTGGVRQKGEGFPDLDDEQWERLMDLRRDMGG